MKSLLIALVAGLALIPCAQAAQEILDIRPGASAEKAPDAVHWQNANDAAIKAATAPEALAPFLAGAKAADALLAQVKPAYLTDPMVATQIAAVTQLVMTPGCPKAAAARELWVEALLRAAEGSKDAYRTIFFLDQLRWCASDDEADDVEDIGEGSDDQAVRQMADLVARELRATKEKGFFSFLWSWWD